MPESFMQWYWDWGIFISGIVVFFSGFIFGIVWYKDRCEKRIRAEDLRIAITGTIGSNEKS